MIRKTCLRCPLLFLRFPRARRELPLEERKGRVEVRSGSHDGLWRRFLLIAPDNAAQCHPPHGVRGTRLAEVLDFDEGAVVFVSAFLHAFCEKLFDACGVEEGVAVRTGGPSPATLGHELPTEGPALGVGRMGATEDLSLKYSHRHNSFPRLSLGRVRRLDAHAAYARVRPEAPRTQRRAPAVHQFHPPLRLVRIRVVRDSGVLGVLNQEVDLLLPVAEGGLRRCVYVPYESRHAADVEKRMAELARLSCAHPVCNEALAYREVAGVFDVGHGLAFTSLCQLQAESQ